MAITKIIADSITSGAIANTPTFLVYKNGDMTGISQDTYTKVTGFTEIFDPQNKFASNKFTPGVDGKFFIFASLYIQGYNGERIFTALYKSGTRFVEAAHLPGNTNTYPIQVSGYIECNTNDYIELFVNPVAGGNGSVFSSGVTTQWGGYKIIE